MRVIAIDGPAGAGKSTVARRVAAATGLPFLDTGAMYRCVALSVLRHSVDPNDHDATAAVARRLEVRVDGEKVEMDGEDVSSAIREPGVNSVVSVIAAHGGVRDVMRGAQREWATRAGGGVVEGRDIGTVVFPDADVKIFLTASPMRMAARRVEQSGGDIHEVARSIEDRDRIDSTRQDSPLRPAEGSITVDSSDMTVDQVVEAIVRHYRDKCGEDR